MITDRRILFSKRNKIIRNVIYRNFQEISFDSMTNKLIFYDIKNKKRWIDLSEIRLNYEENQNLKKVLNEQ